MTNSYLKTKEVAKELRVSKTTVLRYVRDGKLPYIELSKNSIRIKREDLDKFIEDSYGKNNENT